MNERLALQSGHLLVTGAASGIGLATCLATAELGARVLALYIAAPDTPGASRLAKHADIAYCQLDVSDPAAWQALAENLEAAPTHLFLNAGIQIAPPEAPLADYAFDALRLDRYRRMMGVNVDGVVFGLHAVLPRLTPGGAVVVTCSLAGITPYSVDPLYAMSKHAVAGLVRSLAPTLEQRDITINALCPGAIDTAIIPQAQRTTSAAGAFMTAQAIAAEVIALFATRESGKTWAKVAEAKPAFIVRAPGDRSGDASTSRPQ